MTDRTMYDSTTARDIPIGAEMVAGYIDGLFRWSVSDWARFAGYHVHIAVLASTNDGDVLDIERGDATPAQGPGWVKMRRAAHVPHPRPTLYCSRSDVPAVKRACEAAGLVLGTDWSLWIADYTGHPHSLGLGESAVQFANPPASGGHYDLSLVTDPDWPIPVPAPAPQPVPGPAPVPPPRRMHKMDYVVSCTDHEHSTAQALWRADGSVLVFGTSDESAAARAAGAGDLPLDPERFDKVIGRAV